MENKTKSFYIAASILVIISGLTSQAAAINLQNIGINMHGKSIVSNTNTIWNGTRKQIPAASIQQGSGSGLNADFLDGVQGNGFLKTDGSNSMSGNLNLNGNNIVLANKIKFNDLQAMSTYLELYSALRSRGKPIQFIGSGGSRTSPPPYINQTNNDNDLILHGNQHVILSASNSFGSSKCTITYSGGFSCTGAKNWIQSYNSSYNAIYSSQESPQVRAVYEGKAFVNGSANVTLPSSFKRTVSKSNPMLRAQVTPQGTLTDSAVMGKGRGWIVIKTGKPTMVNYRITGVRTGYGNKKVLRPKNSSSY